MCTRACMHACVRVHVHTLRTHACMHCTCMHTCVHCTAYIHACTCPCQGPAAGAPDQEARHQVRSASAAPSTSPRPRRSIAHASSECQKSQCASVTTAPRETARWAQGRSSRSRSGRGGGRHGFGGALIAAAAGAGAAEPAPAPVCNGRNCCCCCCSSCGGSSSSRGAQHCSWASTASSAVMSSGCSRKKSVRRPGHCTWRHMYLHTSTATAVVSSELSAGLQQHTRAPACAQRQQRHSGRRRRRRDACTSLLLATTR